MNDIIATVKILNLKPAKQHDVSAYTKMISLFHSLLKIWNNSQPNDVSQFYNSLVYFRVKHNFSPGTEFSPHFSLKWGQPNNKIIFDEITLIMIIITRDSPSRKHAGTKDFTAKPLDPKRFLSCFRVSNSIKNEKKNIYTYFKNLQSLPAAVSFWAAFLLPAQQFLSPAHPRPRARASQQHSPRIITMWHEATSYISRLSLLPLAL